MIEHLLRLEEIASVDHDGKTNRLVESRQIVRLNFLDSVTVNDTIIKLGEIAKIQAESQELAENLARATAGEAAPPW